jgi:sec-independent protein translocase protein TatA
MGQLGFSEMLVIFIVALLVFGPKKLPELGKSLGKGIREFRKATDDLKSTWEEQVREVENPVKEVTRDIQQVGNDMKSDFYGSDEPSPSQSASAESAVATATQDPAQDPAQDPPAESAPPADPSSPKENV